MSDLSHLTIKDAEKLLSSKKVSSVELTNFYLDRIAKTNKRINSYLTVCEDVALKQAEQSDDRRASGEVKGVLDGVPMALKDIFATKGVRTTGASKILENFIPPYDAFVTKELQNSGAVLLGKLNCDEFAMGTTNENSAYETVKNPWNTNKVSGGSSGGSAVAVAADQCVFSLGTDTGGSIRLPASWNNVFGLRPTYGRVSRNGILAMASSLDQVGAFGKTVADVAELTSIISKHDEKDSTHANRPVSDYASLLSADVKGVRVGVIDQFFGPGIEPDVKSTVEEAIKHLEGLGAVVERISMPILDKALAAYYIICPAEVSTNLERYDGIKYGYSSVVEESNQSLAEVYSHSRHNALGSEAKRRSLLGAFVLSAGYYDAFYHKAQQVRAMIKRSFDDAFAKYDLLVGPVIPNMPFNIGENSEDPMALYLADILTVPVNIAGLPAASVPCGFSDGLPIGMQLIAKQFTEEAILKVAYAYEQSTKWHKQHPLI